MDKFLLWLDNVILVKCEDCQLVYSFKLCGVYVMMFSLIVEQKFYGVIIVLVGNYVQGVVFFVLWLGVKVLIVMLVVIVDIKVDVVCGFGGEVLLYGVNFDEVKVRVIELV